MNHELQTRLLGKTVSHTWGMIGFGGAKLAQIQAIYFNKNGELTFLVENLEDNALQEVPANVCSIRS